MQLPHQDAVFKLDGAPNYDVNNPLGSLLVAIARCDFAAGRESYLFDSVHYLVPFSKLELYEGSDGSGVIDPRHQDNKEDFQKQNLRGYTSTDTFIARGWAIAGGKPVPFLRFEYNGEADSVLARKGQFRLGNTVRLWLKIGSVSAGEPLTVPRNDRTGRYEIEIWGYAGADLASVLMPDGRAAVRDGFIIARPDLIRGSATDFAREALSGKAVASVAPDATMHPLRPLHIQLAWSDSRGSLWDSQDGRNYDYEFSMVVRGLDNYLEVGTSHNPHGGTGRLEYRNLLSNYFGHRGSNELGRNLQPWNFDAHGSKDHNGRFEPFMAVDYMDLHVLGGDSGIGLHRHRDNSEIFFVSRGRGLMVVGDWCKMPQRDRAFEVRTLREGHFAALRGGQLHALMNATDEPMQLLMFGGYD